MRRRSFLAILPGALAAQQIIQPGGDEAALVRPKVPGTLRLRARRRSPADGGRKVEVSEKELRWEVAQTAIIICDMWDAHPCSLSAQRVVELAPRMNQVINAARSLGIMIIHAPSETMKFYEGTPWRKRMQRAPMVWSKTPILPRVPRDETETRLFPIDDSDPGGGGCDDPIVKPVGKRPWSRQNPLIDIVGYDGISDSGQEIYNFCKQEGIVNIALMGVHTNFCILNRSFGIKQMTQLGFNVVLVRDMTDAMYDPRKRPFVSHKRGTELVVEHIETRWCPSILSQDLMQVIPGSDHAST